MTGSLQIKNGKYYAVLNYKNEQGKRKQKWICTGSPVKGNKRKAEQFLQKMLAQYADFSEIRADILFSDYIVKWLDEIRDQIETSTWEGYKNTIQKHIAPYFTQQNIPLIALEPKHISEYYRYQMKNGLSANTVKRHHANIRKCLQRAVEEKLIPANPADQAQRPKSQKYTAAYFDAEQVKRLLQKAVGVDIEPVIVLCTYYGLRRSEVLGLKWSAVNFTAGTLQINHTITKLYSVQEKHRAKNESSNRTLPLIPAVREYLLALKAKQQENQAFFGNCYHSSDYICTKADGSLIQPDEASHKFAAFLAKNAFPHIRLHDLRHSCASLLIAQGVDIKVIQEWLGHSSIATTGNIYGHLQFKHKIATGIVLENLLEP